METQNKMIFFEETDDRFYVKDSDALEANKGLFAKQMFIH